VHVRHGTLLDNPVEPQKRNESEMADQFTASQVAMIRNQLRAALGRAQYNEQVEITLKMGSEEYVIPGRGGGS
jgi:hypothetical protein